MIRNLAALALAASIASTSARADDSPILAPPAAWVRAIPIPPADPKLADKSIQGLLLATQVRYGPNGSEYYVETALLAQNPQGLAMLGSVIIPWDPKRSDLIIHKVSLVRGGKPEDLLAKGQSFTVLRRENNLEAAMLDGILTAVLQPEGLAIGDIINVAYTLRSKPDSIGLKGEHVMTLNPGTETERLFLREIWPEGSTVKWQATEAMGKPVLTRTPLGNELILDRSDAVGPNVPDGAPPRYALPAVIEVSEYSGWEELATLLAPLYDKAVELAPGSPLKEQIERIAASSPDPRRRAMAALRLVQDEIRYLALAMGEAGQVPASADQTWARRYGDCKGKTATLLALLRGLGIESEPVLVHSIFGDSLPNRLPQLAWFDHVIVKATIAGKSYWLDGTRSGDRQLDDLASATFRWGLPLRRAGAGLEPIPMLPPALPLQDVRVTYDASTGFKDVLPVSGEIVVRGELATYYRMALAQAGKAEFEKHVRAIEGFPEGDFTIDFRPDDEQGLFTISFKGTQRIGWSGVGTRSLRFQFDDETIRWRPDFKRSDGDSSDAPFQLSFPVHIASTETLLLPPGKWDVTFAGQNLDRTVAGTRITRTFTKDAGSASAVSSFVRLQPEISRKDATASEEALAAINRDRLTLRVGSDAPIEVATSDRPMTADELFARGYQFLQNNNRRKAIADFEAAAKLRPEWSSPHANIANALIWEREYQAAEIALKKAGELNDEDSIVHQGWGMLHLFRRRPQLALESLTRSLELEPGNTYTQLTRATSYQRLGRLRDALGDVDAVLKRSPADPQALRRRPELLDALGETEAALAAAAKLVETAPDNPAYLALQGRLLKRHGREADAKAAYARALATIDRTLASDNTDQVRLWKAQMLLDSGDARGAIEIQDAELAARPDDAFTLNERCWARATANIELDLALKDCNRALELQPDNGAMLDSRALVKLRMGDLDGALADYQRAVPLLPDTGTPLFGRGLAKLRRGDEAGGRKDITDALLLEFEVGAEYERYGLKP